MRKILKQLIFLYLLLVIIKSILSYFIPAPSAFSDSYLYTKMARSFFYFLNFNIHGLTSSHYPPLYSLLLSVSYVFQDMQLVYIAMKVINAILSSLILFPSWLLAKEFIPKRKALHISLLISLIPSNFAFSGYLMAENLFYPLFLFSIYFIYKSFTKEDLKYNFFAGLFIGLGFLTKSLGLLSFVLVILMMILSKFRIKNLWILIISLIIILPWSIRNVLLFGFTFNSFLGGYTPPPSNLLTYEGVLSFSTWIILNLGLLILASGILFSITTINFLEKSFKDRKTKIFTLIFLFSLGLYLLALSKHNVGAMVSETLFYWLTGRPVGRYMDTLLPLVFIMGFVGISLHSKLNKSYLMVISFILVFSSQLIYFSLFPINNMSIVWLGLLTYFHKSILLVAIFLFLLPFILYSIYKRANKNILIVFFIIFFLFLSLTNYSINYVNSKIYWYDGEQMQIGLWFNDNMPFNLNVLFDERDCINSISKINQGLCSPPFIPMGFWMNQNIKIGNVLKPSDEIDFIISKHDLDYPLIKTSGDVKIYTSK